MGLRITCQSPAMYLLIIYSPGYIPYTEWVCSSERCHILRDSHLNLSSTNTNTSFYNKDSLCGNDLQDKVSANKLRNMWTTPKRAQDQPRDHQDQRQERDQWWNCTIAPVLHSSSICKRALKNILVSKTDKIDFWIVAAQCTRPSGARTGSHDGQLEQCATNLWTLKSKF